MEWLTSNLGPNTRLHPVGEIFFQRMSSLSNEMPSATAHFQLGICYATGFGCERDLHSAVQHMYTSAMLGYEIAQDAHERLLKVSQNLKDKGDAVTPPGSLPLIDLWGGNGSDDEITGSISRQLFEHRASYPPSEIPAKQILQGKGKQLAIAEFPFHDAAGRGDLDILQSWINSLGFDINERNNEKESALICAMRSGEHDAFRILVHAGADPSVTDSQGCTILHTLSDLNGKILDNMINVLSDDKFTGIRIIRELVTVVTLPPKSTAPLGTRQSTPLERAVDVRNTTAIRFLLILGSDPALSDSGSPALHRAASRHDCQVLASLLEAVSTEALMRFDQYGRSTLGCMIADINAFDRVLMRQGEQDLSEKIVRMILDKGHNLDRLNVATESGESVVYYALKSNNLQRHIITSFWGWNWDPRTMNTNVVPIPMGPNQWSAFRRALYCSSTASYEMICGGLGKAAFQEILDEVSPDGLTIFHELAFLSTQAALTTLDYILKRAESYRIKLQVSRMKSKNSRPRMTPFQLAVLCGKTILAQIYLDRAIEMPLQSLEKSRFLAFVIEYPLQDLYTLSTWLSLIREDPIVEFTRRFPYPTSMSRPLQYLLEHEEEWWNRIRKNTSLWNKIIIGDSPSFDRNIEHDPLIAWTPNLMSSTNFDENGEQILAAGHYEPNHVLDNNIFGFGHRLRHTLDYGSFLLRPNPDTQAHSRNGHPYITAIELGLTVLLGSDYTTHAKQNFGILLHHFPGLRYCNFPYLQYLPTGCTRFRHLRRMKTVLHRAIRHRKLDVVQSLIGAGADIHMANNTWHTPLYLARLIVQGKNPDDYRNHGTFFGRLGPSVYPAVLTEVISNTDQSMKIMHTLEAENIKSKPWEIPQFRALREVKWPWTEYETDDFGLRFVLFYLAILILFMSALTLVSHIFSFFPFILYDFSKTMKNRFQPLVDLRDCYLNSTRAGANPRDRCHLDRWTLAPLNVAMLFPAMDHRLQSILDVIDDCYDNSTMTTRYTGADNGVSKSSDKPYLPGCPDLEAILGSDRLLEPGLALEKAVYEFLEKECKCGCSWFNEPRNGYDKLKLV
jgi:ankyrin repeat protein